MPTHRHFECPVPTASRKVVCNGMISNAVILVDADNFHDPVHLEATWEQCRLRAGKMPLMRVYGATTVIQAHMGMFSNWCAELIPNFPLENNTTDISLAVDAMQLCFSGVTFMAIASNDRDFIPLAIRLRQLGRIVWSFASRPNSVEMHKYFDNFVIFQKNHKENKPKERPEQQLKEINELSEDIINQKHDTLSVKILNACPSLKTGNSIPISQIIPVLRQANIIGKNEKLKNWIIAISANFTLKDQCLRYTGAIQSTQKKLTRFLFNIVCPPPF